MAGIFDWLEQNKGVSDALFGSILPSVASTLFTDKPNQIDPAQLAQMYSLMASGVTDANNFAKQQQQFYQQNYLPMAQAIAGRAEGIGQGQDLQRTIDRTREDVDAAYRGRMGQYERSARARGVDPTSAAYLAGEQQAKAGYTPDLLTGMNQAITTREQYGDQARQQALQNLNTKPDFTTGAYAAGSAAGQLANYNALQQQQYRQDLGATSGGLASAWDKLVTGRQSDKDRAAKMANVSANLDDIMGNNTGGMW